MPRPVHFEIPALDVQRATRFFADVFGWKFESWGDGSYQLARTGDPTDSGIDGAIFKRSDPQQPIVNSIHVPSVDEFVARVTAFGGTIVLAKQTVPGMGYYATFRDTEGNIHGLWQPSPGAQ